MASCCECQPNTLNQHPDDRAYARAVKCLISSTVCTPSNGVEAGKIIFLDLIT